MLPARKIHFEAKKKEKKMKDNTNKKASNKDKRHFFKDVKAELKKVVWPTKKELINYTVVVFLVTIFIAFIIYVLDAVFAQLFNTLLHFVG